MFWGEGNQEVRDGQDGKTGRPGGEGNRGVDILFLDSTGQSVHSLTDEISAGDLAESFILSIITLKKKPYLSVVSDATS